MLKHYPPFVKLAPRTDEIIKIWKEYKFTVPVFGGMMLNAQCDKVLMVRGWGKHGVWGFPKGKKDQGEGGERPLPGSLPTHTHAQLPFLLPRFIRSLRPADSCRFANMHSASAYCPHRAAFLLPHCAPVPRHCCAAQDLPFTAVFDRMAWCRPAVRNSRGRGRNGLQF